MKLPCGSGTWRAFQQGSRKASAQGRCRVIALKPLTGYTRNGEIEASSESEWEK